MTGRLWFLLIANSVIAISGFVAAIATAVWSVGWPDGDATRWVAVLLWVATCCVGLGSVRLGLQTRWFNRRTALYLRRIDELQAEFERITRERS